MGWAESKLPTGNEGRRQVTPQGRTEVETGWQTWPGLFHQPPPHSWTICSLQCLVSLGLSELPGKKELHLSKEDWGFPGVLVVKNPPANAGDIRDEGSISYGSGRSPGGGHGNPLQ